MITQLEQQWREEFQALFSNKIQRFISYQEIESSYPEGLEVYLAARRKAQEEFNTYKRDFLNAEKCMCEPMPDICECAHCLHKMISRQDEEISQLKEEIDKLNNTFGILKEIKRYPTVLGYISELKEELEKKKVFISKVELQISKGYPTAKEWHLLATEFQKQRN